MNKHKRRISWIAMVIMAGCLARAFAQAVLPVAAATDTTQTTTTVSGAATPAITTPSSEVMAESLGEPVVSSSPVTKPPPEMSAVGAVPAVVESELPSQRVDTEPVTPPAETLAGNAQVAPVADTASTQELIAPPVIEPAMPAAPENGSTAETTAVGVVVNPVATETSASPAGVVAAAETNVMTELIELQPEGSGGVSDKVETGAKENLISISLDNVPLQDVMRMFARISGANIVSGTNLQGNITVNLKDVEWQPALRTILDTAGMTLVMKSPGIYSVVSKSEAASAPVTIDTIYLKFTTVTNVLPVIQKMLISSNASVAGFPAANALVIQETSERLDIIKEVVTRIDKPRPQVFIEAKFVELNDEAIKDLGINWQSLENYTISASKLSWGITENRDWVSSRDSKLEQTDDRIHSDGVNQSYDADGVQSLTAIGPPIDGTIGRSVVDMIEQTKNVSKNVDDSFTKTVKDVRTAVLSAADFELTLSALKQQSGVSVVSNPRIVVASGETAKIHVGREDPNYVTKTVPGVGNTPQTSRELSGDMPFVKTGVEVDVRPVVNTESNITIRITPTLSRILSRGAGQLDGDLPPISKREINSEFNLESGRTVAIGGLTTTDDRENIVKIPVLGDIPIIGKYLFSHSHTDKIQDEVIIFVTVGMASPDTITVSAGIPTEGKLIHRHLAQQAKGAEAAAKASK
jgi:type IV pilus assembly protein PilQ